MVKRSRRRYTHYQQKGQSIAIVSSTLTQSPTLPHSHFNLGVCLHSCFNDSSTMIICIRTVLKFNTGVCIITISRQTSKCACLFLHNVCPVSSVCILLCILYVCTAVRIEHCMCVSVCVCSCKSVREGQQGRAREREMREV